MDTLNGQKNIKLIVTDMDGTLLNDQHEIHPDFWEIEKKLSEKGIMSFSYTHMTLPTKRNGYIREFSDLSTNIDIIDNE